MDTINLGLLKVTGPEAKKFLQGLITCDVEQVAINQSCYGAHCNPKGRILFNFQIFYDGQDYFLILPLIMLETAQASLQKYALFSKVSLQDVTDDWPSSLSNNDHNKTLLTTKNPSLSLLQNIQAGIAIILPPTSGVFTPHDIDLPKLNGVGFKKGCYIGQEVIARMEYLGKLKNHLQRYEITASTFPQEGDEIIANDSNNIVGHIVNIATKDELSAEVLVVIQDNAVKQAWHYADVYPEQVKRLEMVR